MKDEDKLSFSWIIDYTLPHYRSNPTSYLNHILGHEGENSLLSFLRAEGLAMELSSGTSNYMNLFTKMEV